MCPTSSPLLIAALAYAQRGLAVFPCHTPRAPGCSCGKPDCSAIGKHPCQRGYLKAATTDPARLRYYWSRWPDTNVAIATGSVSGTLVIDVDPRHGGDENLADLEAQYGPLPDTPQVCTGGGGSQLYFAYPHLLGRSIPSGANVLGPGLDIRADGGYVIAPPSLHASSRRYEWEVCHELDDTPLAPLPAWVLEHLSYDGPHPKRYIKHRRASKTPPKGGVDLLARSAMQAFPLPSRRWTSWDLTALLGRADVVGCCLPLIRLEHVAIGKKFTCAVHLEKRASAAILAPRDAHETYVYADFHGAEQKIWPLPVIYWAIKTGKPPERMPPSSLLVWTVRLLVDAGVLAPARIPSLPPLPPDAPSAAQAVYDGFRLLLQCRWHYKEDPAPFSWRFGAVWCGVSQQACGRGLRWLLQAGYLVGAGMHRRLQLFLLGTVDRIRRLARRVTSTTRRAVTAISDRLKILRRTTPSTGQTAAAWERVRQREARLRAAKVAHGSCAGCDECLIVMPAEERVIQRLRQQLEGQGPP